MKVLLDTNILIDYWCRRQPFFNDAVKLRVAEFFNDIELWSSGQTFTDAEYILSRIGCSFEVRTILRESLRFLNIAMPVVTDLEEGLTADWEDLEDFLIAKCAERIKADYILTRDKTGFIQSKIPVLEPKEFLLLLKDKYDCEYDVVDFLNSPS